MREIRWIGDRTEMTPSLLGVRKLKRKVSYKFPTPLPGIRPTSPFCCVCEYFIKVILAFGVGVYLYTFCYSSVKGLITPISRVLNSNELFIP